jgi:hypothetical protein
MGDRSDFARLLEAIESGALAPLVERLVVIP